MQLFVFDSVQPAVSLPCITAQFDSLKLCLCECDGLFEQDRAWNREWSMILAELWGKASLDDKTE